MQALKYYDEVWVYGCQNLYDPVREYRLPAEIVQKIRFCGYLDIEAPIAPREDILRGLGVGTRTFVLVTIGNGSVGYSVLDAYVRALERLPPDLNVFSLVVGGPALPTKKREIILQQCEAVSSQFPLRRVRFVDFLPNLLDHMAAADLVISQGGYNTVTEIFESRKARNRRTL